MYHYSHLTTGTSTIRNDKGPEKIKRKQYNECATIHHIEEFVFKLNVVKPSTKCLFNAWQLASLLRSRYRPMHGDNYSRAKLN